MHKCRSCLCRSCMNVCGCQNCSGPVRSCGKQREYKQISLFEKEAVRKKKRVLLACEESQRVCIEFRKLGHEAYSCDIEYCSGGHPEWHIQQDVLPLLNGNCEFHTVDGEIHKIDGKWDMIIAFPPCTYLTVAGNRWFDVERYGEGAIKRHEYRKKAIKFFMQFVNADCERIAIENPVGIMSTEYKKPDCIIQPWQFGHNASKSTCLWLKNLDKLEPTDIVEDKDKRKENQQVSIDGKSLSFRTRDENGKIMAWNDPRTAKIRSKTFSGIAKAMAEQWGGNVKNFQKNPRFMTWQDYGISKKRYKELKALCQSGKYNDLTLSAAHTASKEIGGYIYLSVTQNRSYEGVEYAEGLGRIPCGRTDFYGYRRLFYSVFDKEIKGKVKNETNNI